MQQQNPPHLYTHHPQRRHAKHPPPQHLQPRQRRPPPAPRQRTHQRLRSPHRHLPHTLPSRHLLHHEIHKLARHHNHLHHRLPFNPSQHLRIRQRRGPYRLVVTPHRHLHHRHQLPIHLHRNLQRIFPRQLLIRNRPRSPKHLPRTTHLCPQLRSNKRSERSQQQRQPTEDLGNRRSRNLPSIHRRLLRRNLIHQDHDRSDRSIEVPPSAEILRHLRNRLMQLPQQLLPRNRLFASHQIVRRSQ